MHAGAVPPDSACKCICIYGVLEEEVLFSHGSSCLCRSVQAPPPPQQQQTVTAAMQCCWGRPLSFAPVSLLGGTTFPVLQTARVRCPPLPPPQAAARFDAIDTTTRVRARSQACDASFPTAFIVRDLCWSTRPTERVPRNGDSAKARAYIT